MSANPADRGLVYLRSRSACQIDQDGRAPSIWDTFSRLPNKTLDGTDTTVTTDTYVQWRGDIELMKSYGVNSHRLSLSWSRIIPLGGKDDSVNQAGIDWYREYLKALVDAGIVSHLEPCDNQVDIELIIRLLSRCRLPLW